MSNQDSNKSFFQRSKATGEKFLTTAQIGIGLITGFLSTPEQSQPENEAQVLSSQVQSVSAEVDQLASIQEKEQEEKRQESKDFSEANNQVIASGSPNPDPVEVIDNETQQLAISTAVNLAQVFDENDFESETSESENQTETSNISTAVDLTEAFDKGDFESESSESSKSESESNEGTGTE